MKSKSRFLGIDDAPFRFSDERVPVVGVVVQAPAYIEKYEEFKAKGVNEIFIVTVNDAFVTKCVSNMSTCSLPDVSPYKGHGRKNLPRTARVRRNDIFL